jgi:Ca2+-binding EF-hand superfamily protein
MIRVLLGFVLLLTCIDLYGQRRGGDRGKGFGRGYEAIKKAANPDEDKDYKVDSAELREWVASATTVFGYGRDYLKEHKTIKLIDEFDKDRDGKISSKEARELKNYMKKVFDNATKKLILDNDANNNRRLDKKEIIALRDTVPDFLTYALENKEAEEELAKKPKEAEKEPEKERSNSITDIYD